MSVIPANLSIKKENYYKFKDNLCYIVNSRPFKETQQDFQEEETTGYNDEVPTTKPGTHM